jgi:acyl-CoA thioester hydrolase
VRLALEPSLDPADYRFTHPVRVRFAETDAMGVVHHAAYLPYLEETRIAFLEAAGHPYEQVRAGGVDIAVLEVFAAYRRPLRFGEEVVVHLGAGAPTVATFQIGYLLTVGGEARATAVTVHGCVGPTGSPMRVPGWLRGLVTGAAAE